MGKFNGPVYVRPMNRGICVPGDRYLEDLFGDENAYYELEVTWKKIDDPVALAAAKNILEL